MSAPAAIFAGFVPVTDPDDLRRGAERLARDFGGTTFDGENLSDDDRRRAEHLDTETRAQRHRQRSAAINRAADRATALADRHVAEAAKLEDRIAPKGVVLSFNAAGATLDEVTVKSENIPERVDLDQAAGRLGKTRHDAVVFLGLASVAQDDAGMFSAADVDDVARDLGVDTGTRAYSPQGPTEPAPQRLSLDEAASRLALGKMDALVALGMSGHLQDDAGTFAADAVDAVRDDLSA